MLAPLGEMHVASYRSDPKHGAFVWARYNFVAKMLMGSGRVLEVGCGDTSFAHVVAEVVDELIGIDRTLYTTEPKIQFAQHDIIDGPYGADWDAVYALDVLEHIAPQQEDWVLCNMRHGLCPHGKLIIGMPSRESQPYASRESRKYHVNCKTEDELQETMRRHFHTVYLLGMNDSTLLASFGPMQHYRFALCSGKR